MDLCYSFAQYVYCYFHCTLRLTSTSLVSKTDRVKSQIPESRLTLEPLVEQRVSHSTVCLRVQARSSWVENLHMQLRLLQRHRDL